MVTPWSRKTAFRAGVTSLVLGALAFAVGAATDEGGVPWMERFGRVAPLAPLLAAGASWLTQRRVRSRGDEDALRALGVSPTAARRPAAIGAAAFGLATATFVARGTAQGAFYPKPIPPPAFAYRAGDWVDETHGILVTSEGQLARAPRHDAPPAGDHGSLMMTVLTVALASVLFAWAGTSRHARTPAIAGAVAVLTMLAFQAVAAGVVAPWMPILPSAAFGLGLLGHLLIRGRWPNDAGSRA